MNKKGGIEMGEQKKDNYSNAVYRIYEVLKEEEILIGDVDLIFQSVKKAINISVPVSGENLLKVYSF